MLAGLLRPRLSTGAILVLAVPLAITAGAAVTLAVVAVRREGKLSELLTTATESLKQGIAANAEAKAASQRFHQLLEDIGADIAPVAHLARRWKDAARQTATPDKTNTEPAPAAPMNHAPEVT